MLLGGITGGTGVGVGLIDGVEVAGGVVVDGLGVILVVAEGTTVVDVPF